MKTHNLTVRKNEAFRKYLVEEEKSEARNFLQSKQQNGSVSISVNGR